MYSQKKHTKSREHQQSVGRIYSYTHLMGFPETTDNWAFRTYKNEKTPPVALLTRSTLGVLYLPPLNLVNN